MSYKNNKIHRIVMGSVWSCSFSNRAMPGFFYKWKHCFYFQVIYKIFTRSSLTKSFFIILQLIVFFFFPAHFINCIFMLGAFLAKFSGQETSVKVQPNYWLSCCCHAHIVCCLLWASQLELLHTISQQTQTQTHILLLQQQQQAAGKLCKLSDLLTLLADTVCLSFGLSLTTC